MTDLDLDAIEARANAATPGPWVHNPINGIHTKVGTCVATSARHVDEFRRADAAHIAGMDPATTLALVAEVRALRAALRVSGTPPQEPQRTPNAGAHCPGCGRADCSWKRLECDGSEAHQPLRVLSNMGIPFVHCSCRDDKHPQSAIWLREHWTGTEDEGVAELRAVVARQRDEAARHE